MLSPRVNIALLSTFQVLFSFSYLHKVAAEEGNSRGKHIINAHEFLTVGCRSERKAVLETAAAHLAVPNVTPN